MSASSSTWLSNQASPTASQHWGFGVVSRWQQTWFVWNRWRCSFIAVSPTVQRGWFLFYIWWLVRYCLLFLLWLATGWLLFREREREGDGHRKKKSTLLLFFSKDALRSWKLICTCCVGGGCGLSPAGCSIRSISETDWMRQSPLSCWSGWSFSSSSTTPPLLPSTSALACSNSCLFATML